jgi:hypothetical protein
MIAAPGTALASPGCTALQGSEIGGVLTGSTSGAGFSAGDVVTLTVNQAGAMSSLGLSSSAPAVLLADTMNPGSRTYTVPTNTTATFTITGLAADPGASYAWSCVSAGGSTGTTDSQKLTTVQTQGTAVVANTSGANISGSVNGAIDNALGDDSSGSGQSATSSEVMSREEFADYVAQRAAHTTRPEYYNPTQRLYDYYYKQGLQGYDSMLARGLVPVRTPSGYKTVQLSSTVSQFAAERRSAVSERADEAFAALGYAAVGKAPRQAPVFASRWSTWADVRGSGFEQSDSRALKGTQINATGGITYKLRSDLVVGAFAGYENFNYDFASLTGKLKGNGGTIGTYAGWQITPTLRWKGMIGWTGLGYDASAATASGNFDGARWLVSTGLTGSYRVAAFIVEPSADIFAIWERQTGYTDNLGVAHDTRNFSTGRVSLGGRALAPMPEWSGVTPYLGFYGDWRFASDTAQLAAVPFTGIGDGWSARVTGGVNMRVFKVGSLSLGGEYSGIGADYKVWTGKARLAVPF